MHAYCVTRVKIAHTTTLRSRKFWDFHQIVACIKFEIEFWQKWRCDQNTAGMRILHAYEVRHKYPCVWNMSDCLWIVFLRGLLWIFFYSIRCNICNLFARHFYCSFLRSIVPARFHSCFFLAVLAACLRLSLLTRYILRLAFVTVYSCSLNRLTSSYFWVVFQFSAFSFFSFVQICSFVLLVGYQIFARILFWRISHIYRICGDLCTRKF